MTTAYTSLLGLALPVTGELSGTWGDTVNNAITSLLDTAVAGTTSITTDADITLTTTTGASNQARQAIILWNPASGTTTRNITAPAQSKIYTVINASGGPQSIVLRGVGPTTGVTIVKGESAVCAWNGTDFIKVSNTSGAGTFTNLTVTGNTILGDASADTVTVNGTITSNLIFTDNTYDIGASGATRPRNLFLAGGATLAGTLTLNSSTTNDTVLINRTTTSTNGILKFQTASADKWIFGQRNVANDNLYIYSYAASADIATFSSTGLAVTGTLSATGDLSFSTVGSKVNFATTSSATVNYVGGSADGFSLEMVTQRGALQPLTYKQDYGVGHVWSIAGSTSMTIAGATGGVGAVGIGYTSLTSVGNNGLAVLGSVGIGTSGPESRLAVKGSSGAADLFSISDIAVPTSGAEFGVAMIKTASTDYMLNLTSYGATGKGARIYHTGGVASDYAFLVTAGADRFIVDGRGNLGVAVVPKATWDSGSKALQIGSSGALWERTSDNLFVLTANSWFDGATDRYIEGGFASRMYQVNGVFTWETAPSGSTDGPISWDYGMSLNRDGQLAFTTAFGVGQISNTRSTAVANGATVDFSSFSGMLIVNNYSIGSVGMWISGGGAVTLVSSIGSTYGTFAYQPSVDGYRWTNNTGSTFTFSFTAIRYRPNA